MTSRRTVRRFRGLRQKISRNSTQRSQRIYVFPAFFRSKDSSPVARTSVRSDLNLSGLTSAATSINEDEDGSILGGFDHVLKLLIRRVRRFEFGVHIRHRFEEAQQQTALDRVIQLVAVRKDLRQRPARRQRHRRIQLGLNDADHVAPLSRHQTIRFCSSQLHLLLTASHSFDRSAAIVPVSAESLFP